MPKEDNKTQIPRKDSDYRELTAYIEKEFMNYDENQALQKDACLRLIGLQRGKLIANNSTDDYSFYPFKIILAAFKINKVKILGAIKGKTFKNEFSKMAYICTIIERDINDVYMRITNAEKSKIKTETVNTDVLVNTIENSNPYVKKTKDTSKKLEGLW